ncbi:SDR family oxidoreductase [Roseospira marina]|uniref:SDR family oxidoreductase n=1 Tax=Roseospira marina TaxID=140057 RepID=UPI00182E7F5F|nr:SDR family oxidoreductase [Roseospira marina]MBB4314783.1 gluconate 5-dehydrogenase [Roseospira marina]MBB5087772.1 gluconate 5-dehydrogenase [Roseospira marina]
MSASNLFDLTGRRALVTGSGQGIGFSLARGLAQAGAEIILNDIDPSRLEGAATTLRDAGVIVHTLPFDVTAPEAVAAAIDGFEAETGPIDILVNNAGMQVRAPLEAFPVERFDALMRLNLNAVFYCGQAVARHMIGRGAGKIVNICSVQTALARPSIAPYTASKGGVANLTKGMATDWARHGLQINGLAPGYFKTELTSALVADEAFTVWLSARTPAGRWGDVEELIGACVFLASPASSFVNGHILYVDGGITSSV